MHFLSKVFTIPLPFSISFFPCHLPLLSFVSLPVPMPSCPPISPCPAEPLLPTARASISLSLAWRPGHPFHPTVSLSVVLNCFLGRRPVHFSRLPKVLRRPSPACGGPLRPPHPSAPPTLPKGVGVGLSARLGGEWMPPQRPTQGRHCDIRAPRRKSCCPDDAGAAAGAVGGAGTGPGSAQNRRWLQQPHAASLKLSRRKDRAQGWRGGGRSEGSGERESQRGKERADHRRPPRRIGKRDPSDLATSSKPSPLHWWRL